jgi:hypothetical protein
VEADTINREGHIIKKDQVLENLINNILITIIITTTIMANKIKNIRVIITSNNNKIE